MPGYQDFDDELSRTVEFGGLENPLSKSRIKNLINNAKYMLGDLPEHEDEWLGFEELENGKEPTGKYKSSGYGDLKENDMKKSDKLKELLEEAVAGVPSLGNPFADRKKTKYESKFETFLAEAEDQEEKYVGGDEKFEYEKGKKAGEKEEKKKMKKEGRMKMSEVLKEANRLGEIARMKVEAKVYEAAIAERKKACSINEDESLSEFINQSAIQEVEKEIKELEKKLMEVSADKNTMTGGK
jgi:hypothetical protein